MKTKTPPVRITSSKPFYLFIFLTFVNPESTRGELILFVYGYPDSPALWFLFVIFFTWLPDRCYLGRRAFDPERCCYWSVCTDAPGLCQAWQLVSFPRSFSVTRPWQGFGGLAPNRAGRDGNEKQSSVSFRQTRACNQGTLANVRVSRIKCGFNS